MCNSNVGAKWASGAHFSLVVYVSHDLILYKNQPISTQCYLKFGHVGHVCNAWYHRWDGIKKVITGGSNNFYQPTRVDSRVYLSSIIEDSGNPLWLTHHTGFWRGQNGLPLAHFAPTREQNGNFNIIWNTKKVQVFLSLEAQF